MPTAEFGKSDNIPGAGTRYVSLSSKGDKITFRLAGKPTYRGQHWLDETGEYQPCAKVNSGGEDECEYCEDGLRPQIKYSFPIVNRETKQAQIFETTLSVKEKIDENANAGIDVYKADWTVTRNEGSPANYYSVVRIDPIPLDKTEKEALKQATEFDLEGGDSKSFPESEAEIEELANAIGDD